MNKADSFTLFTVQTPGHDITVRHEPSEDYTRPEGAFYEMAKYLGWPHWIWTLPNLKDFDNQWLVMERILKMDLWVLLVPETAIRWRAMDLQCENDCPLQNWLYPEPETIRGMGDIPQGLVKSPIEPEWVKEVLPITLT